MDFRFYPLRFEFVALDPLYFPPGKASNVLRGALGIIFRSIACTTECRRDDNSKQCSFRNVCPYAKVFEPRTDSGPSGLADPPRPFVFRASHLDGKRLARGEAFHFDLNLFTLDPETISYFVLTFGALAREGLGPARGSAELRRVLRVAAGWLPEVTVFSPDQGIATGIEPVNLGLETSSSPISTIRVQFATPMELKQNQRIVERPDFPILFARVRDRIANLRAIYGAGPLELDFQGIGARAGLVRMTECRMRHEAVERRSSRTGQSHSIGGFVGVAEYEGDLAEFLPWLEVAGYTGVGRQAVWGKGEIRVSAGWAGEKAIRRAPGPQRHIGAGIDREAADSA